MLAKAKLIKGFAFVIYVISHYIRKEIFPMAKVTIIGDIVQIKSDLTRKELERIKTFAPEAVKLFDKDDNEIFGIDFGHASFSKYGICFCSEDSEGKLFMTTDNPVLDHSDKEAERIEVTKYFAPIISKLQAIEENVASVKDTLEGMEASVADSVVFAD